MVGADESTELWRHPYLYCVDSDALIKLNEQHFNCLVKSKPVKQEPWSSGYGKVMGLNPSNIYWMDIFYVVKIVMFV